MFPALFIDGRNTTYRAVFAARSNPDFQQNHYHPFVMWIRFVRGWIEKFKPGSVHVFWDCPKESVWRKKIYPEYKDGRVEQATGSKDEVEMVQTVAQALLPLMNTRMYQKDNQEADDLIYSACRAVTPEKAIVISSDSDMLQIPWHTPHIVCYEPRLSKIVERPELNPVMLKAITGEKTDNIEGYRGIGEVKGSAFIRDRKSFQEFLAVRGDKIYRRNLSLIDLSLNPYRLSNEMYVEKVMVEEPSFSREKIGACIMEHKVRGLSQEYSRSIVPFKNLGAR